MVQFDCFNSLSLRLGVAAWGLCAVIDGLTVLMGIDAVA